MSGQRHERESRWPWVVLVVALLGAALFVLWVVSRAGQVRNSLADVVRVTTTAVSTTSTVDVATTVAPTTTVPATTTRPPETTTTTEPRLLVEAVYEDPPWTYAGASTSWGLLSVVNRRSNRLGDDVLAYFGGIFRGAEVVEFTSSIDGSVQSTWVGEFALPDPYGGDDIIARLAIGVGVGEEVAAFDFEGTEFSLIPSHPRPADGRIQCCHTTEELVERLQEDELYLFRVIVSGIDVEELIYSEDCVPQRTCNDRANECLAAIGCWARLSLPDPFGLRYSDLLTRRLSGEDVDIPAEWFGHIFTSYFAESQW